MKFWRTGWRRRRKVRADISPLVFAPHPFGMVCPFQKFDEQTGTVAPPHLLLSCWHSRSFLVEHKKRVAPRRNPNRPNERRKTKPSATGCHTRNPQMRPCSFAPPAFAGFALVMNIVYQARVRLSREKPKIFPKNFRAGHTAHAPPASL